MKVVLALFIGVILGWFGCSLAIAASDDPRWGRHTV